MKIILSLIALFATSLASAQQNDKEAIKKVVLKAFLDNSSASQCATIDLSFSMVTISFDKKGKVEAVHTSKLPPCYEASQSSLESQIKTKSNELSLTPKQYRNQSIILLMHISAKEETFAAATVKENWLSSFTGLDGIETEKKAIKYVLPVQLDIYPTQH